MSACPFLSCNIRGDHRHESCEQCGAVRHGNISCLTCLRWNARLYSGTFELLYQQALTREAKAEGEQ